MATDPKEPNPKEPDPQNGERRREGWPRWSIWMLVALVLASVVVPGLLNRDGGTEIDYSGFVDMVADGQINSVIVTNETGSIKAEAIDGSTYSSKGPIELPESDLKLLRDRNIDVEFRAKSSNPFLSILPLLLPFVLIIGLFWWMQRRAQGQMSGIMSIGRSKAKTYTTERPDTGFDDIAGYQGVKQEITEVVDFLKAPERFAAVGARIPKGVLLVGPPGTGKTLIARAVAGEAGVPFLSVTGSDFMEMFVGVGASRVRDLFQTARKLGSAIIFIDEIDSIGRKRGAGLGGGHDEREQTLNQMLAEMDGFEATEGIVMMAATNRPDILDPALLRPGRFDRQVVVPLPEYEERLAILGVHVKGKKFDENIDLEIVAKGTPGMSGADLANLVNEAALSAVRMNRESIQQEDFESARDRILMGQRRESVAMTDSEKEVTAYHEGGHAIVALNEKASDPIHKATIIPRGRALGMVMQLPEKDEVSQTREQLHAQMAIAMGGRVAEELIFGDDKVTTGAVSDIEQATKRARAMVMRAGLSKELGPVAYGENEEEVFLGRSVARQQNMSEETAKKVDAEIRKFVERGYDRARKVLTEKIDDLHKLAKALLTYETLTGKEIEDLVNKNIYPAGKQDIKDEKDDQSSALGSIGLKPKIVH